LQILGCIMLLLLLLVVVVVLSKPEHSAKVTQ
jgi:hypothetical protein